MPIFLSAVSKVTALSACKEADKSSPANRLLPSDADAGELADGEIDELEMVSVFALLPPGLTLVLKEPFAAMLTKLEAVAVSVD